MTAGWSPLPALPKAGLDEGAGTRPSMVEHLELSRLHAQWAAIQMPLGRTGLRSALKSGRPSLIVRAMLERTSLGTIQPRIEAQQEMLGHLIRLTEALAQRCDALSRDDDAGADYLMAQMIDLSAHLEVAIGHKGQTPG